MEEEQTELIATHKFPCPECGGEAVWNAKKQALICPYCGVESQVELTDDASLIKEHDLLSALGQSPEKDQEWSNERVSVKCQSCQAISLFIPGRVAQNCEFCGSSAVLAYGATGTTIHPESLLPFMVPESEVREQMRKWYKTRWFAPNKLKRRALTDTVHGVYIPYWTFDAQVHADWSAQAGYYYYTTVNGRRTRHIRWRSVSGSLDHFFDDALVPGTRGVDLKLLQKAEPFPTHQLVPYDRGYVSGWVVEQYQLDLQGAAKAAQQNMQREIKAMCARRVPGDTYRALMVYSDFSKQTFKHILAPVWLLTYTYGRKSYQVIVNGYTGKIAGKHPLSWVKLFFTGLMILTITCLIYYFIYPYL